MRQTFRVIVIVILCSVIVEATSAFPFSFQKRRYFVRLSGGQVVPPVQTGASASFFLFIDKPNQRLKYSLKIRGPIELALIWLHLGREGINGPLVANLIGGLQFPVSAIATLAADGSLVLKNSLTADDFVGPFAGKTFGEFVAAIRAGEIYVEVHSIANPGGELRGQIQ